MKIFERLVLLAGLATMGALLWKLDAAKVWLQVSSVGWGLPLILSFQIFDHLLNALGWRFAFNPADAPHVPFRRLVLARIAGDGVNYLTPSGQIAGELIRPAVLGPVRPADAVNTSVVVAKLAQALGQALFILFGLGFVLKGRLDILPAHQKAVGLGMALLIAASTGTALGLLSSKGRAGDWLWSLAGSFSGVRGQLRTYLSRHPFRFALSTGSFMAGYGWGALEVLLICRLMGVPMPLVTCLAVEVLSNIVDSVMFMVPAKVGTQEAGKTAIFVGLGYQASQGLALGLIRHTRELAWASAGFLYYALTRRGRPSREPRRSASGPLTPA